jgi:hypothetical protein
MKKAFRAEVSDVDPAPGLYGLSIDDVTVISAS